MLGVSAESKYQPVGIGPGAASALVDAARLIPLSGWDFEHWPDTSLGEMLISNDLRDVVSEIRLALENDGFCVVRFGSIVVDQPETIAAGAATLLTTAFGSPLRIYANNRSHWRALGADPNRPSNKSEGTGLQLHHTDFVNAECPPDVVCLLCLRPDPRGGGASIVAKVRGIEDLLDRADVETLSRPIFHDGQVVNLSGIGRDINPFAVISSVPGDRYRYRYVGHLLESAPGPEAQAAISALARALMARTVTIPLAAGDLLLVNQHLALHGRAPLGSGQESIPVADRRKLLLGFLRN